MTELVEGSNLAPRKKNVFGRIFDSFIDVEKYEQEFQPEQMELLKKGENLVLKWLDFEQEYYEEETSDIENKRRKRQTSESGKKIILFPIR